MAEVKIEIANKLYNEILEMCKFNSITVENYVLNCVMDNFYTLKFGDINEKLQPKQEKSIDVTKSDDTKEEKKSETVITETAVSEVKKEEENNNENAVVTKTEVKTKKRRILKVK